MNKPQPSVNEILTELLGYFEPVDDFVKEYTEGAKEAIHALVLGTVMEAIGEDEDFVDIPHKDSDIESRNELRQELRNNLQEALGRVFHG